MFISICQISDKNYSNNQVLTNNFFFFIICLDMEDFSKLSSKTVTEVLMLELKMSPAAKTFLISGFPRNMRDAVEYTNKVSI